MDDKTVHYDRTPELPADHRPTRVYTVLVDTARYDARVSHGWEAKYDVRERTYSDGRGFGASPEQARDDAARRAVERVWKSLAHDLTMDTLGPVDRLPNVGFRIVYV